MIACNNKSVYPKVRPAGSYRAMMAQAKGAFQQGGFA
jgi:hypothetical protein